MTEETNEPIKKSQKSSTRSREKSNKWDKVKVLKKVIIRRLPPSMTEETFLEQIEPLPDHDSYYFVPADWSLGHDTTARAYINFTNQDDIFLFKDRFDGYVFVDNKGAEYPAIVEFAPFQGLPRNKSRKRDPKASTIESEPHYISFLENLTKEDTEKTEFKLEYSFQIKDDKKITSTPLLQYLANKKQERRDERKRKMDEKRRQRDEERQRKKNQVSKNIPQAILEEDSKTDEKQKEKSGGEKRRDRGSGGGGGGGVSEKTDDRKESRNRRRDQKRKEERERNLQKIAENRSAASENRSAIAEIAETSEKSHGGGGGEEDDKRNREYKKYSQSRRDKQLERRASGEQRHAKDSSVSTSSAQIANKDEVNDTVKEFIKNAVFSQEFVSKAKESSDAAVAKERNVESDTDLKEVKEKLQQLGSVAVDKKRGDKVESTEKRRERRDRDSDRNRQERNAARIRNKDRPTMEIYQPRKMRVTSSGSKDDGGRSSSELKDYKSNPTSDCESVKKENIERTVDVTKKKVSRYSERRSGRVKERSFKEQVGGKGDDVMKETKEAEEWRGEEVEVKFEDTKSEM